MAERLGRRRGGHVHGHRGDRGAGARDAVLAFSTITNPAAGITGERLSHAEVMEVAKRVAGDLEKLIGGWSRAQDDRWTGTV